MSSEALSLSSSDAPATGEGRSRIGRNLSVLAAGQFVTWSTSLVWTVVVPRTLGPAHMGVLVTALSVTGVLGVLLGLGTRNYLVREMVADGTAASRLAGTGLLLRLVLTPVFVAATAAYAVLAHYGHEQRLVLALCAGATILTLLAEPLLAGFQAIERMEYLAYSDVITKSAQGVLGVALVLAGLGVTSVAAAAAGVAGLTVVLDIVWFRRHARIDLQPSIVRLADLVRQSLSYWAFGLFFLVYLWIDAVMLSLLSRTEVVGWYGVATRLFQTTMFAPVLVSTAWLPRLVQRFEESPERLRHAGRTPLELVLLLAAPLCAGTALAASPMIHLLYGPDYRGAATPLVILGLCIPPTYANIVINQMLIASRRQSSWTWVMAGATVFNPLVNAALIPLTERMYDNGAIGAALSLLATELLVAGVGFWLIGRGALGREQLRRCGLVALAAAGLFLGGVAARPLGSAASLTAGAVVFIGAVAFLRVLRPEELAVARDGLRALARRLPSARGRARGG